MPESRTGNREFIWSGLSYSSTCLSSSNCFLSYQLNMHTTLAFNNHSLTIIVCFLALLTSLYNAHHLNFDYCATIISCIAPVVCDGEGEMVTCSNA